MDAAKTGRDAALETWRIVKDQYDEGAEVNIQQLAQASEQYHFFEAQVVDAYNTVLDNEGKLRFLFGWASTDGRFLRPIDEPVMAPVEFDWCTSLCEALSFRPELRQERWEIKKRELALAFSKNGLLPELNVTFLYRWLGLGNRFGTAGTSDDFPDSSSGALNELFGGNFQELQFGGSFGVPIGFRRELANVRNAQLKLAREIARVEDMELDITKELAEAMRALAANQLIMLSSFNRWKDTTIEEEHFERLQDAGVETLDVALDAQRRRSQAAVAFYTAMCEYNKVIALIHRRKGTILPYSGVQFSEGPWPGKAYSDATEHARRRGASEQINYGWSRPSVISRGEDWPTAQNTGHVPTGQAVPAPNHQVLQSTGVAPIYDPYAPHDQQLEGDYYEGAPIQPIDGAPYYDTPAASPFDEFNSPTPAFENSVPQGSSSRGSSSRNKLPSKRKVQQITYIEEAPKKKTARSSQTSEKTQPVAILKPEVRKQLAAKKAAKAAAKAAALKKAASRNKGLQRDLSPKPLKRLKAAPNATTSGYSSNLKPKPASNAKPVSRTLAWEKLGLSRPENEPSGISARIKTK